MDETFSRTESLLGELSMSRLRSAKVAVFGVGGVGGYAAEALARCGVGELHLIDHHAISVSNLNRQIIALRSTVGKKKVEIMAQRIFDICPQTTVRTFDTFYLPETASSFDFTQYDYIIDAIDTVTGKLALIEKAYNEDVPVISSMGTGNKLDPTAFEVTDVYKTSVCPLARVMRKRLKMLSLQNCDAADKEKRL